MVVTLGELARRLECPVEGDEGVEIHRIAKIESAGPGDLTFLANPKYAGALAPTKASAVIAGPGAPPAPCPVVRSALPYLTFARAAQLLSPAVPGGRGGGQGLRTGVMLPWTPLMLPIVLWV